MIDIYNYLKYWTIIVGIILIYSIIKLYKMYYETFDNQIEERHKNVKSDLMALLNVSNERIQNINVIENENNLQIEFEILPRKIGQEQQPLLKEIKENVALKISKLDFPMIRIDDNNPNIQKPFARFDFQEISLSNQENKIKSDENKNHNQFINPSYSSQKKYLTFLENGFHHDPEIDRTYKFDEHANIYLEPLPTFTVSND